MEKAELQKLLETRLPEKPSIEQLRAHIRRQDELIRYLFESAAIQAKSIIDIRERMVEHKDAIEGVADMIGGDTSDDAKLGLIGISAPKLVVPN